MKLMSIESWWIYVIMVIGFAIYFTLLIIVLKEPIHELDAKTIDYEDEEQNKIVISFHLSY